MQLTHPDIEKLCLKEVLWEQIIPLPGSSQAELEYAYVDL
jgi:hypothetical protein